MTFKEYKKLWALPADIKARESRIEKLLRRKDTIAQDTVHGSAENFPYTKHTVIIRGVETDADVLAMQERLKKLNDEYDRLYGRAMHFLNSKYNASKTNIPLQTTEKNYFL